MEKRIGIVIIVLGIVCSASTSHAGLCKNDQDGQSSSSCLFDGAPVLTGFAIISPMAVNLSLNIPTAIAFSKEDYAPPLYIADIVFGSTAVLTSVISFATGVPRKHLERERTIFARSSGKFLRKTKIGILTMGLVFGSVNITLGSLGLSRFKPKRVPRIEADTQGVRVIVPLK